MLQQARRVEIAIIGEPRRSDLDAVGHQAKIGNEPHPVPLNEYRDTQWQGGAKYQSSPEHDKRKRVGFKKAVRKSTAQGPPS